MKNQMAMTSFVDSQFYNKVLTLKIKIMNDLVVLRQGFEDSLNLLADNEMDFVKGGDVNCGKGYTHSATEISCKCKYKTDVDEKIVKNGNIGKIKIIP